LLEDLADLLITHGVMDASNYLVAGEWTTDLTAAVVNYNAIREDKSLGFHNPAYIEAILLNTIEAVTY
jgi:hypothetical protein